jgi:uncharacterized OsmC-like protein
MREYLCTTLKEVTEKREARYRANPDAQSSNGGAHYELQVVVRSIGHLDEHVKTKSGHEFIISEPLEVGGRNIATWPLEYLLGGAVGCYAAVFAFYAAKLNVSYDELEIKVKTFIDVRGHMIPDSPPSAFQKVVMELHVVSDEPEEKIKEIERLALAGCPGIDTLRRPVPIESNLHLVRPKQNGHENTDQKKAG